ARLETVEALPDDASGLSHLLDADDVAGVRVAALARRHDEVELLVALVRLRAAQVPLDARGAEHRAGQAPLDALLAGDDAHADGAALPDAVVRQELLVVVDPRREVRDELGDAIRPPGSQVERQSA